MNLSKVSGLDKICAQCKHAAQKNEYINTIPSIHICLNKESDRYLDPLAWSESCKLWELMPENVIFFNKYYTDISMY